MPTEAPLKPRWSPTRLEIYELTPVYVVCDNEQQQQQQQRQQQEQQQLVCAFNAHHVHEGNRWKHGHGAAYADNFGTRRKIRGICTEQY
ncbi:hypothetical protein KIN20_002831 [Parelaphostrongylus tenuis]|uniref:Uncharacterized protein n=1 Tax=Parelaphostrongylus tenuis TaxID=148309 RepID=A0AAD5LWD6_PARTN|nr:hypothetical protein KIN20_002831 [Parelaphostrongylus tenuis]